jgi:transposase
MVETIQQIINGTRCPQCQGHGLFKIQDGRWKCSECSHRYSPKRVSDDLNILHDFGLEIPATKTAKDLKLSYNKVRNKFMEYRQEILEYTNQEFRKLSGEIECDETYFGGRKKGPRGRGSLGKIKVFGMLERQGKIFTSVVDNVTAETLMTEIKQHAEKGSVFYTDQFKSYKSLMFYGKHFTIDHGTEFACGRNHINGLEGFWSFAKERLLKYHGINKQYFPLYLKELEFRYNHRKENIYELLTKIHFGPVFN